ncbi:MAG TPA: endolytic transglycosylase MltG [Vicinamibacteria bacterium]
MRKLLLFLLVVAGGLYLVWYHETRWPVRRASDPPQTLIVEPGAGVLEIGRQLQGLGLVRHPEVFRALVVSEAAASRLRAGEYALEGEMSLDQIVEKMVRGDVVHHMVTFPEGTAIEEMARIVASQGIPAPAFLEAARDVSLVKDLDPEASDLEGYLFPDTYEVEPRRADAAVALVKRMVHRFREVEGPMSAKVAASGVSLREVVTLASLVELETARKEERPHIAAVFLNRLRRRMPLQTDPTVIYALRRAGTWDGNIRKEDLDIASPYNTYRVAGLPPGPIAAPGREAIRAVLEPLPSDDLYFVSRNDGSHQFSRTLAEHDRAVNLYQRHRHAQLIGPSPSPSPSPSPGPSPPATPPRASPTHPPGPRR